MVYKVTLAVKEHLINRRLLLLLFLYCIYRACVVMWICNESHTERCNRDTLDHNYGAMHNVVAHLAAGSRKRTAVTLSYRAGHSLMAECQWAGNVLELKSSGFAKLVVLWSEFLNINPASYWLRYRNRHVWNGFWSVGRDANVFRLIFWYSKRLNDRTKIYKDKFQ